MKIKNYINQNGERVFLKLAENSKVNQARLKHTSVCKCCGNRFYHNRSTAIFCSNSCRVLYCKIKNGKLKITRKIKLRLPHLFSVTGWLQKNIKKNTEKVETSLSELNNQDLH